MHALQDEKKCMFLFVCLLFRPHLFGRTVVGNICFGQLELNNKLWYIHIQAQKFVTSQPLTCYIEREVTTSTLPVFHFTANMDLDHTIVPYTVPDGTTNAIASLLGEFFFALAVVPVFRHKSAVRFSSISLQPHTNNNGGPLERGRKELT